MIYLLRFKDIVSNHEHRQGKFYDHLAFQRTGAAVCLTRYRALIYADFRLPMQVFQAKKSPPPKQLFLWEPRLRNEGGQVGRLAYVKESTPRMNLQLAW